jgi:hypothetical protein
MPRWKSLRLRKLPARFERYVMPLVLSGVMTCVVSLTDTLHSLGFSPNFIRTWPGVWLLSWAVAFPTVLLALPLIRRAVALVVEVEEAVKDEVENLAADVVADMAAEGAPAEGAGEVEGRARR